MLTAKFAVLGLVHFIAVNIYLMPMPAPAYCKHELTWIAVCLSSQKSNASRALFKVTLNMIRLYVLLAKSDCPLDIEVIL